MLILNPNSLAWDDYHLDQSELAQCNDDQLDQLRARGKIDLGQLFAAKLDRNRVAEQMAAEKEATEDAARARRHNSFAAVHAASKG